MKKKTALLWVIAILIIVAIIYLIKYVYDTYPEFRKGPSPAPLIWCDGTSIFLIVILTLLLIFVIRNLRKT